MHFHFATLALFISAGFAASEPDCDRIGTNGEAACAKYQNSDDLYCTSKLDVCKIAWQDTSIVTIYKKKDIKANEDVCKKLKERDKCSQRASCCYV